MGVHKCPEQNWTPRKPLGSNKKSIFYLTRRGGELNHPHRPSAPLAGAGARACDRALAARSPGHGRHRVSLFFRISGVTSCWDLGGGDNHFLARTLFAQGSTPRQAASLAARVSSGVTGDTLSRSLAAQARAARTRPTLLPLSPAPAPAARTRPTLLPLYWSPHFPVPLSTHCSGSGCANAPPRCSGSPLPRLLVGVYVGFMRHAARNQCVPGTISSESVCES